MADIELGQAEKEEVANKLKNYLAEELSVEIGGFDALFLLDFFIEKVAYRFYNQGLTDALQAFEGKLDEFGELIYQLEKQDSG